MAKTKALTIKKAAKAAAGRLTDAPLVLGVVPKGELREIKIADIHDPPGEPDRLERPGDAEQIAEVARSLREVGQLQPVMVEFSAAGKAGWYQRVFGRRRIAAAKSIGQATILAIVVPPLAPDARRTIVAVENIQRKDLSPAEEHLAVAELIELQAIDAAVQFGKAVQFGGFAGKVITPEAAADLKKLNRPKDLACVRHDLLLDHRVRAIACDLVAAMLAKSPTWVRDRMYVGRMGPKGRALVLAGRLPLAHARMIAKVADPQVREELADSYAAGGDDAISSSEAGPLERLAGEVTQRLFALKVVPWRLDVALGGKPPCNGCPHNSESNPGLFEHRDGSEASEEMHGGIGRGWADSDKGPICTDHRCYAVKLRAAKPLLAAVAKKVVDEKKDPSDVRNAVAVLRPQAMSERCDERRAHLKARKGTIQRGKAAPSAADEAKKARDEATREWQRAMEERADELQPAIAKALAAKPGAWAVYHLFRETKLYQATQAGDAKAAKAVASAEMNTLLQMLANPTWDAVLTLERGCGRMYDLIDSWYDGKSGMADRIAQALGISIDPPPTVEDFLPKAQKQPAAAKRPAVKRVDEADDDGAES